MPMGPNCFYLATILAYSTRNSLSRGSRVLCLDMLPHGSCVSRFWSAKFCVDPVMVGVIGPKILHKEFTQFLVGDVRCIEGGHVPIHNASKGVS